MWSDCPSSSDLFWSIFQYFSFLATSLEEWTEFQRIFSFISWPCPSKSREATACQNLGHALRFVRMNWFLDREESVREFSAMCGNLTLHVSVHVAGPLRGEEGRQTMMFSATFPREMQVWNSIFGQTKLRFTLTFLILLVLWLFLDFLYTFSC